MPRAAAVARSGARGAPVDGLQRYRAKRDFSATPEPEPAKAARPRSGERPGFVVQKHAASRLHYDFRLELDGVLLSWAVPKGPSYDPADKRMAVRTEDHPLAYADFEGTIPAGHYGAGEVIVWDRGVWQPVGDPHRGLAQGKLAFDLAGHKLKGRWELVRMHKPGTERQEAWLLFKKRDADARPRAEFDVVTALPDSVKGRAQAAPRKADGVARKAPLPKTLAPQLATLASSAPTSGDWICEHKFDGYRLMARLARGRARLFTRGGLDWSSKLPHLVDELEALGIASAWLDGEIVLRTARAEQGDFNALQNAFDRGSGRQRIDYCLFDLPYFDGHDLRDTPLYARRELLRKLLEGTPAAHLQFSADLGGDAPRVMQAACERRFEGVMAKRRDAPYRSARTDTWLKLKCHRRQEFVVGGFTDRSDAGGEIGSLLLGVHDAKGRLLHAGSVGTGWDTRAARGLHAQLAKLERATSPFDDAAEAEPGQGRGPRRRSGAPRWVKPSLVVEVKFGEWTPAGRIRHASFVAVRGDKPARAIGREPSAAPPDAAPADPVALHGIKVSHPERVIDAKSGLTKLDLVRYYDSVAEWILPHLQGRPVALVRAPDGVAGTQFFQKHGEKIGIPGIHQLPTSLAPGEPALLEVRSHQALLGAAQMNVVEFHTWNATTRHIDKPDRMVFDLDPGEGVAWTAMQEAARLTRALLEQLGLRSWLKTSGGKGLHLVVPLAPRWDADTVKGLSHAVVLHLAQTIPQRFVARSGPANRVGKIFVDYLRNGQGATTVAAFSARARPGLGVSMPLPWDALDGLKRSDQWTIANAREALSLRKTDPWADYAGARQSLGAAMKALGFKPSNAKQRA
jgi:bifunctional non-homologous end joining protein LigD